MHVIIIIIKNRTTVSVHHVSVKVLRASHIYLFLLKARKRQREEAESGGGVGGASVIGVDIIGGGATASASSSSAASRAELINERIGYKPHPKPATLPTLFGSLQF